MRRRIKIRMLDSLCKDVGELAEKLGMPMARLITMMVTDSIMNTKLEISSDGSSKNKDKRKSTKYVNVSISDEIYDMIVDKITEIPNYYMNDYVVDCVNYQFENFKTITETTFNHDYIQGRRINKSVYQHQNKKYYSENVRKKYKVISPLDGYIMSLQEFSEVKKGYIEKYYLAKQIEQILNSYGDDEIEFFNAEYDYESP